ncbi:unnamed protein product [Arctia plantaginis]|uniref:NSFL1 cofactor p47 n=1 Tax=Arctia plantaginis TaxID=874455 RepID=A0A8S0ZXD9_ARCPL|nr:unnamed protein product [Arctia plantaginis]
MSTNKEETLRQFCDVTGADESRSKFFLESSNWQLDVALSSFYEHGGNADEAPAANPNAAVSSLPSLSDSDMDSLPGSPLQTQKKDKKKVSTSKFATLDTLQQDSSSSDEEEGQAFYAGGSERSGQQIIGPGKGRKDIVTEVFKSVRERGAVVFEDEPSSTSRGRAVFSGVGYRLGQTADDHEPVPTGEQQAGGQQPDAVRSVRLRLYREGFTVDSGPLRSYTDPDHAEFLNCIRSGVIPPELSRGTGGEVRVSLEDRRHEECPRNTKSQPFTGKGHLLGSPTPVTVGATHAEAVPERAANQRAAQDHVRLDAALPTTTIQVQLCSLRPARRAGPRAPRRRAAHHHHTGTALLAPTSAPRRTTCASTPRCPPPPYRYSSARSDQRAAQDHVRLDAALPTTTIQVQLCSLRPARRAGPRAPRRRAAHHHHTGTALLAPTSAPRRTTCASTPRCPPPPYRYSSARSDQRAAQDHVRLDAALPTTTIQVQLCSLRPARRAGPRAPRRRAAHHHHTGTALLAPTSAPRRTTCASTPRCPPPPYRYSSARSDQRAAQDHVRLDAALPTTTIQVQLCSLRPARRAGPRAPRRRAAHHHHTGTALLAPTSAPRRTTCASTPRCPPPPYRYSSARSDQRAAQDHVRLDAALPTTTIQVQLCSLRPARRAGPRAPRRRAAHHHHTGTALLAPTSAPRRTTCASTPRCPPPPYRYSSARSDQRAAQDHFRLADGSRLTGRFNHTHTVADLHEYVSRAEPTYQLQGFTLFTTFPSSELSDPTATLVQADVLNSTLLQRLK